jgi:DNA polymerase-3 subunit delta'
VHLLLVTDAFDQVLPTVVSRCQPVRFDRLPARRIAAELEREGIAPERAAACARLALGNAARARYLASEEGAALLADVDRIVSAALGGGAGEGGTAPEPWRGLLDRAEERRALAEAAVAKECRARLESEPKGRERTALERAFEEAARRDGRRARTELLDLGLTLAALGFRDLVCLAAGADAAALDPDRAASLGPVARARDPRRLRAAAERCEDVRLSLEVNVTEDLALEALGFKLARLVGAA